MSDKNQKIDELENKEWLESLEIPVFLLGSLTLALTISKSVHLSSAQSVHPKPQFNPSYIMARIFASAADSNLLICSESKVNFS